MFRDVLVLSPSLKPLPPIDGSRFAVSLDAGPKFRPTHVRLEGDDPIALSILLDVSDSDGNLVRGIDEAIAGLAPNFLRQADHVSIYALDCSLKRSLYDGPADGAQLKRGVEAVLRPWNDRRRRKQAPCEKAVHLWDGLAIITRNMSSAPGRRVILAVTDGQDKGSRNKWNELRVFAAASGVAIFGMTRHEAENRVIAAPSRSAIPGMIPHESQSSEDPFQLVCAQTGGLVFTTTRGRISKEFERFTTMLRERYIVEFPRTDSAPSGVHSFDVTIANTDAVVRSTGLSVPIADPRILADPTTIPSDPSHAPQTGSRRVLTPQ